MDELTKYSASVVELAYNLHKRLCQNQEGLNTDLDELLECIELIRSDLDKIKQLAVESATERE